MKDIKEIRKIKEMRDFWYMGERGNLLPQHPRLLQTKLKYPVIEIPMLPHTEELVIRFNIMNQLSSSELVWLNDELKMQTNNLLKLKIWEIQLKK